MTLAGLVLLAADKCPTALGGILTAAEAMQAKGQLDRRSMAQFAQPNDGGSVVNLLYHLSNSGEWNDATVLARHARALTDARGRRPEVTPVLTLPSGAQLDLPLTVARQFETTLSAFRRLVKEANTEILLVSAFVQASAAEAVGADLADATRRGVKVVFITQRPIEGHNPGPVQRILDKVIAAMGNPSLWEFRTANLGAQKSMHAKVMIVDRRCALVGSANFTGPALADNVEVGLVVSGDVARVLAELIEFLSDARNDGAVR